MPKGDKAKSRKKTNAPREEKLIEKDDEQLYAVVLKELGGCNMQLKCSDGSTKIGKIRNAIKKKGKIGAGDIVLVSIRDFQDNKVDILHKYGDKSAKELRKQGEFALMEESLEDETNETDIGDNIDFSEI